MRLYHFTSERHLPGIARHGLTVGDVPTDIRGGKGKVGVWFTTADTASGHGLLGSTADKTRFRLQCDVTSDSQGPFAWLDWSDSNATAETRAALSRAAGGVARDDTWFVYFGVVPPEGIVECFDQLHGRPIEEWRAF